MKKFLKSTKVKRVLRVAALALGAGLSFMGVGNLPLFNMDAANSVMFGAIGTIVALIIGLSFTFAAKGDVPDKDFDELINQQIEAVNAKTKKDKENG